MPEMNPVGREFEYRPRWLVIIAGAAFFTVCGLVLWSTAAENNRGLIINGLIELFPENATTFYWVLCWLSFGFVAMCAFMLLVRVLNPQKLILAEDGLYAPKRPWSKRPTFIRYGDVISIASQTVSRQTFLKIRHMGGKQNIAATMFESKLDFEAFSEELAYRLRMIRGEVGATTTDAVAANPKLPSFLR